MTNPSKKLSPVGRVKNHSKAGKFLPKKPLKDGMATSATDKAMSKKKPDDAMASYKPNPKKPDTMIARGATAKYRKKGNTR